MTYAIGMVIGTAGYCHLRQDLRAFRLDRVVDVRLTDALFVRPTDFDLLDFIETSIGQTPGTWAVDVLLQTSVAEARQIIPRAVGIPQPHADGAMLRSYVQRLEWFVYFLAGLDCPLKVLGPPEAQAAMREFATKLTGMINDE